MASAPFEPVSHDARRLAERVNELERGVLRIPQFQHRGSFQLAKKRNAFRCIPWSFHIPVLENEFQDRGVFLFKFSYGHCVVNQKSRDMVDSADDLQTSQSVVREQIPKFLELYQANQSYDHSQKKKELVVH